MALAVSSGRRPARRSVVVMVLLLGEGGDDFGPVARFPDKDTGVGSFETANPLGLFLGERPTFGLELDPDGCSAVTDQRQVRVAGAVVLDRGTPAARCLSGPGVEHEPAVEAGELGDLLLEVRFGH